LAFLGAALLASAGRADDEKKPAGSEDPLEKEALALNDLTGLSPMNGRLQQLTNAPEEGKKLLAVAVKMTKKKAQPFNRNATFVLAIAADSLKQVEAAGIFYRLNIEQNKALVSEKGQVLSWLGLADMYSDNRKYAEAEAVCREYLEIASEEDSLLDQQRPHFERQQVRMLYLMGKAAAALKKVDKLIGDSPTDLELIDLKARVLRELERYDDAEKTFLKLIDQVKQKKLPKDSQKRLVARFRYSLSGVYVDMNKIDKAAEQLKSLLEDEPDNPTYNNDLGYIWADRGMNLEESEKMIRKALVEDKKRQEQAVKNLLKKNPEAKPPEVKDNSAYLDSLGWVLFKQSKFKEAKPHLVEAVKDPDGQHIEIFDHLGDVHWALGEKTEAVAAWKKGLENVTATKRDQKRKVEVEKKLKMNEEKSESK